MTLTTSFSASPLTSAYRYQDRPNASELAFIGDRTQLGRVIISKKERLSVFLNRQTEFISYETREEISGNHKVSGAPYTRWRQRSIFIIKVKEGRLQVFAVQNRQTKNLTNHALAGTLEINTTQMAEEILALAARNNLNSADIPDRQRGFDADFILQAFAYPPTRYLATDVLSTDVPACLAELLREKNTVEEVFQHVTNNPEGELRELLLAELGKHQLFPRGLFYRLCWILTTTKGILSKEARFHLVAGFLKTDVVPETDEAVRWKKLGHILTLQPILTSTMPTLKAQRAVRQLMKQARDQQGQDGLWKMTAVVLRNPRAMAGSMDGFSKEVLLEKVDETVPLEATNWKDKRLLEVDVAMLPAREPTRDVKDLERFFVRLAKSKVFSLEVSPDGLTQTLKVTKWVSSTGKVYSEEVAYLSYPSAEDSQPRKRRFRNIPQAGMINVTGGARKPAAVYPNVVLKKLVGLWNETEDVLESEKVPISDVSVGLVLAWRLTNKFQLPTRRVLRLAHYGLVTPAFLRLSNTRQRVSDASVLEGLPLELALSMVK